MRLKKDRRVAAALLPTAQTGITSPFGARDGARMRKNRFVFEAKDIILRAAAGNSGVGRGELGRGIARM
jgi:hypothetical protein